MSVQIREPQQRPNPTIPPVDGAARPHSAPVLDAPPAAAPRRRPGFLSRRVLLSILAVVVVIVAVVAYNTYREGQLYVSTDNAQLTGQPVQVGAMNAGRVEAILPSIGASVHKGDVVAQVSLPSQVGVGQAGQAKMGFLGAGDTRVDVQSPIDGIVIAEPVALGSSVNAGQAVVSVVDPSQLWVNANIEETNIGRVQIGQPVTVHVDALATDIP
ncbi:MAG TPA: efflux RND transporter periplasmic adaptor subunit, partial [Chloroflexota bacterium]|nr:efflux RND transporter periplasmic adaptor subunit [Chloroflexota bacterium]